jgi:hypothetical protein
VIVEVVAAGEKADATAATMMRVPTTRAFLMVLVVVQLATPLATSHRRVSLCSKALHHGGIKR